MLRQWRHGASANNEIIQSINDEYHDLDDACRSDVVPAHYWSLLLGSESFTVTAHTGTDPAPPDPGSSVVLTGLVNTSSWRSGPASGRIAFCTRSPLIVSRPPMETSVWGLIATP